MDDDFGGFLFALWMGFCVFWLVFALLAIADSNSDTTRLQSVCTELGGKITENVCIKNGEIVYKD